jgi:adenylylsulfate kinase
MTDQKYVCIDLDGTIAQYQDWQGETSFGEPVEGVQAVMSRLKAEGWKIIVFTTRSNTELIADYLKRNSITYDTINYNPDQPENATGGKPFANAYIDDRGT